jgi:hypothetical protein
MPRPSKRTSKLQEPLAIKSEHPALQNMKFLSFLYFCESFLHLLDPDPDPIKSVDPDPDSKHFKVNRYRL